MELRQLRYFVAVAETGNISRAAQRIFLTQPALSRQIKSLEEEIGQSLLERSANSIRLTPMGEAFLTEARDLIQRADGLLARVRDMRRNVRLRVGYAPSLASGLLSRAMATFYRQHPNTHVALFDLSTKEMLAGLEDHTLDVALTVGSGRTHGGLKWMPLARVSWQLAVSRGHRLARKARVSPADVAREPLLVFSQRDYPEYWNIVIAWLRGQRQLTTIAGEYDGVNSLLSAVASGQGVALVTTCTASLVPRNVRLRTLKTPPKPLCIAAGYHRNAHAEPALAAFVSALSHVAKRSREGNTAADGLPVARLARPVPGTLLARAQPESFGGGQVASELS